MRQCGGCTLCCKLIPVEELSKPAGARCQHQITGKGCRIYSRRPLSCHHWSCMWLVGTENGEAVNLYRPDRTHYVIDQVPDIVRVRSNETGKVIEQITVMQIWVDPLYPDAWRDKLLLDMLERNKIVALIRYNSSEGFAIFPPGRTSTGKWEQSENHEISNDLGFQRALARKEFWSRAAKETSDDSRKEIEAG